MVLEQRGVLVLTLMLAASQVFATAPDTYFQLTIMVMIFIVGVTAFAHFQPFEDHLLQHMQVGSMMFPQALGSCVRQHLAVGQSNIVCGICVGGVLSVQLLSNCVK